MNQIKNISIKQAITKEVIVEKYRCNICDITFEEHEVLGHLRTHCYTDRKFIDIDIFFKIETEDCAKTFLECNRNFTQKLSLHWKGSGWYTLRSYDGGPYYGDEPTNYLDLIPVGEYLELCEKEIKKHEDEITEIRDKMNKICDKVGS